MLTPYDWQEAIAHRAGFIEGRLVQAAPILALSIPSGVVVFTYHRHSRKIFEVYDQLCFAAIGQQSDVEALRTAAIDFAHQEGYNRSEEDVTLRRVVTALSSPIKRAFADFGSAPFIVRSLFIEVGHTVETDLYAILDYEGDFTMRKSYGYVAGTDEFSETLKTALIDLSGRGLSAVEAHAELRRVWDQTFIVERPPGFTEECVLLERGEKGVRFLPLSESSLP